MMENSKACRQLRKKHGVSNGDFCKIPCAELPCNSECVNHDPDTLTEEEEERYLKFLLENVSALDLIKAIPAIEKPVHDHYINTMFEMKEADVDKLIREMDGK